MALNDLEQRMEKLAMDKALKSLGKSMASGAVLGGGIAASSYYDKNKDVKPAHKVFQDTGDAMTIGAGVGALAGTTIWAGKSMAKDAISGVGSKIGSGLAKIKKLASEEKTAGVLKTMAIPAVIGGALSGDTASNVAQNNPYLDEEDTQRYITGKKVQGAVAGAGVGYGAYRLSKAPKKLISGIMKKAEIKIPEKEDLPEDEAIVRDSPNDKEIEDIAEPINNESMKRNQYKYLLEKLALESVDGYLKPISCESCGYKGLPKSDTGMCPDCGTLGGKVVYAPTSRENCDLDSKERNLNSVWEMGERTRQERLSYYM